MRFKSYALLILLCALIILSKGRINFTSPRYSGWDLESYRAMAQASPRLPSEVNPPYRYRVLGPYIVEMLPLPDPLAFWLVTSIAALVLAVLFYQFLVGQALSGPVAMFTVLLFTFNRYFFGLIVWDFFQIDDILCLICFVLIFGFLLKRRWILLALGLAIGCTARETVLIMIPAVFVYQWETKTLRRDWKTGIIAAAPALVVFVAVHLILRSAQTPMGMSGIFSYYSTALGDNIYDALTPEVWFRRLIWAFMPLTLIPFIFWKITIDFFSSRKYLLTFFLFVVATNLWGIGAGNIERLMAPSFLAFYWLIGEITQLKLASTPWTYPALLVSGFLASLHHQMGLCALPSKRTTLLVTLAGFAIATGSAFIVRYQDRSAPRTLGRDLVS